MDFYHDVPWNPATGKRKNECKKCNCNEHSDKCYFDRRLYDVSFVLLIQFYNRQPQATGFTSGGRCEDCQHNTFGVNCEYCADGYYQDPEKQITDPDICKLCDCEADGTEDDGLCDERTSEEAGTVAGQCHCKTYVSGIRCDHCTPGIASFQSNFLPTEVNLRLLELHC